MGVSVAAGAGSSPAGFPVRAGGVLREIRSAPRLRSPARFALLTKPHVMRSVRAPHSIDVYVIHESPAALEAALTCPHAEDLEPGGKETDISNTRQATPARALEIVGGARRLQASAGFLVSLRQLPPGASSTAWSAFHLWAFSPETLRHCWRAARVPSSLRFENPVA